MADRDIEQMLEEVTKGLQDEESKEFIKRVAQMLMRADAFILLSDCGVAMSGGILEKAVVLLEGLNHPKVVPLMKISQGLAMNQMSKEDDEEDEE